MLQLVGQLFIKDPSARKTWTEHVNAPRMIDNLGNQVSGPPQTFADATLLAESILRSASVIAGIDELSSPSGPAALVGLSVEQTAALTAAHIDPKLISISEAAHIADALISTTTQDPRKNLTTGDGNNSFSGINPITVPKGEDSKYLY